MGYCLVTFRSVTPAQRGEGLLKREGIYCALQRTPRWMEEQGCGYSLRLRQQDCQRAIAVLRSSQVSFRRVYRQKGDAVEEWTV